MRSPPLGQASHATASNASDTTREFPLMQIRRVQVRRVQIRRAGALASAVAGLLLALPSAALAHAEITPTEAASGQEVQFAITSLVERPEANGINTRMQTLLPRAFTFVSCDLPLNWTCTVDTETYAPDTLLVWEPIGLALPTDINFGFTAVTPDEPGTWLLRTLQLHFDGFTEPWVYDAEPYPAPKVTIDGDATLVNGEGSDEDPPCFGPDEQPNGYDAHDGTDGSEDCAIPPRDDQGEGGSDDDAGAPSAGAAPSATSRVSAPTVDRSTAPLPATGVAALLPLTGLALSMASWGLRPRGRRR